MLSPTSFEIRTQAIGVLQGCVFVSTISINIIFKHILGVEGRIPKMQDLIVT